MAGKMAEEHEFPETSNESIQHSLGETAHHSSNPDDSTNRPPHHYSSKPSQHQSPSSDDLPQYSSVNLETSKKSHGVHDEEREGFDDRQWCVRKSISDLSSMTTDALDSVVPPPSDGTLDSQAPRRVQVAFAGHYDESKLSNDTVRDTGGRKARAFKSRALSARFFESPVIPPHKEYTLRELLFIAYQTLGVVYGDLGTSPLYVYPTINVTNPTELDFLGILSLIFWTLTLIGVVKYTMIVLQADDHGEGENHTLATLEIDLM